MRENTGKIGSVSADSLFFLTRLFVDTALQIVFYYNILLFFSENFFQSSETKYYKKIQDSYPYRR